MRNFYYSGLNGDSPFPIYSYADVYHGKVPADSFKGKIVMSAPPHPASATPCPRPLHPAMPPAVVEANVVSCILQQNFFTSPGWTR